MRSLAMLALALTTATGRAALIEVVPGPGTPLQDAIDAAVPRDKILVRSGAYPETIVIDKRLNVVAELGVEVGPELDPLESSCAPAFVLEIATTDPVSIKAIGGRNAGIEFQGGGTAAVRIGPQANVKFKKVRGHSFCPGASGVIVDGAARVRMRGGAFTGYAYGADGGPGCRIRGAADGDVMLKGVRCAASLVNTGGAHRGGPGLLLENVAAGGPRGTRIFDGTVVSCGSAAAVLEAADGVWIKRGFYRACPYYLGEAPYYAITLDAQSDGNLVEDATLAGPVLDAGAGNCFRDNVDEDGAPLPDDCT